MHLIIPHRPLPRVLAAVYVLLGLLFVVHSQLLRAAIFAPAASSPTLLLRESCGVAGNVLAAAGTAGGNNAIDPGELVEVRFALTNQSSSTWNALSLFLVATNGITSPKGVKFIPGPVAPGDRIEGDFTFLPTGLVGEVIQPVVQIVSGATLLEQVTVPLRLGKEVIQTTSYLNSTPLTIPTLGPASTYPSTVNVPAPTGGTISSVRVRLFGVSHNHPSDIQVLLVGPLGQRVLLMNGVGGESPAGPVNLVFDSAAAQGIPATGTLVGGTFKPSTAGTVNGLPAPAPSLPFLNDLSAFKDLAPSGTWSLYVADSSSADAGSISGGWSLELSTTEIQSCDSPSNPVLSGVPAEFASSPEDTLFTLPLVLSDDTTPSSDLQITVQSSNTNLVPTGAMRITGTGGSRTLEALPATNRFGVGPEAASTITVRLQDKDGLFVERKFRLDITPVNDTPVISSIGNFSLVQDQPGESVPFVIEDLETEAARLILFASSTAPSIVPVSGVQISGTGNNRQLSIRPAAGASGFSHVSLSVLDESGAVSSTTFLVIVSALNRPPSISLGDVRLTSQGESAVMAFQVSDGETPLNQLTVSASSGDENLVPPGGLVLTGSGSDRILTVTPASGVFGTNTISIRVTDAQGLPAVATFQILVTRPQSPNFPPRLGVVANQSMQAGQTLRIPLEASDLETSVEGLRFSAEADLASLFPPGSLTFIRDGTAWFLLMTAAPKAAGTTRISVTLKDSADAAVGRSFLAEVLEFNSAPEITTFADVELEANSAPVVQPFNVADSETPFGELRVTASIDIPTLATLKVTGQGFERQLVMEPKAGASGSARITVTVTDGGGKSTSTRLALKILPPKVIPQPVLEISRNGQLIELSWSESASGFVPEFTEDPAAGTWKTVSESISANGGRFRVAFAASGSARFFRLRHP